MNIKFSTFLLSVLLLAYGVNAQDNTIVGTWNVTGENPKEETYSGSLSIERERNNLYSLQWDIAYDGKSSKFKYPGTAFFDKKSKKLFAAYGVETYRYGLIQYELNDKKQLVGRAVWSSHNGSGYELLAGKLEKGITGRYQVVGTRPLGDLGLGVSETYEGTLVITKEADHYRLKWYLGDGQPYGGFAYVTDGKLVGVWGIGDSYGLELYEFDEDMKSATSEWISPMHDYKKGTEKLTK